MVDSLLWALPFAEASTILDQLGLARGQDFALLTVHRPSNVDVPAALTEILSIVAELADDLPVIFPAHPRTRARIAEWGLSRYVRDPGGPPRGVLLTEPLGYLDFVHLMQRARVVLTDSGGVQDETTALGVPCLTLRPHTERPVTVTSGTAVIVDRQREAILTHARPPWVAARDVQRSPPPLWDGHTAERIVHILAGASGVAADRRSG